MKFLGSSASNEDSPSSHSGRKCASLTVPLELLNVLSIRYTFTMTQ